LIKNVIFPNWKNELEIRLSYFKLATGIAPVVMDLLNMHVSLKHHWMSVGNWSFAFEDFYRENITEQIDSGLGSSNNVFL